MGGYAWVTLATNDSYSLGALVLAHSLKQVGTNHQLAVLVTPGVTNSMREKLASVFNLVQEVNILDSKDEANLRLLQRPELGITFTKLHCWKLTQYDKCVFLDADTLVLQNCDELFEREELSAAPDVGWPDCFNSGVFVYKPSIETYGKLVEFALNRGSFDGGDQGLLNLYFSDWAYKDISKHLPFIYNMSSTASYSYLPAYKQFGINAKIVHFIGNTKPWLQYMDSETRQVQVSSNLYHLKDVVQRWWDVFCSVIHPALSPEMAPTRPSAVHFRSSASTYPPPSPPKLPTTSSYIQPISNPRSNLEPPPPPENFTPSQNVDYTDVWDPWEKYENLLNDLEIANISETLQVSSNSDHIIYCNEPTRSIESHNTNESTTISTSSNTFPTLTEIIVDKEADKTDRNFESTHNSYPPNCESVHILLEQPLLIPAVNHHIPEPLPDCNPLARPNECESSCLSNEHALHVQPSEPQYNQESGLAGAFARLTLGTPRSAEQVALEDHLRRQGWEVGNIDYMGRDSFDNIWSKICATLAEPTPEITPPTPAPTPTKEGESAVESASPKLEKTAESVPQTQPETQTPTLEVCPRPTPIKTETPPVTEPTLVTPTPETPKPTPEISKPPTPVAEAPKPETPLAGPPKPSSPIAETPQPATAPATKSAIPVAETPKPHTPTGEIPTPETAPTPTTPVETPKASTTESPKSTTPTVEVPKPTTPVQEAPKPTTPTTEVPQSGTPVVEKSKPAAPVGTDKPATPTAAVVKPGTEAPKPATTVVEAVKPVISPLESPKPATPTSEQPKPATPPVEAPKPATPTAEISKPVVTEPSKPTSPISECPKPAKVPETAKAAPTPKPPTPTTEVPKPPTPTAEIPKPITPTTETKPTVPSKEVPKPTAATTKSTSEKEVPKVAAEAKSSVSVAKPAEEAAKSTETPQSPTTEGGPTPPPRKGDKAGKKPAKGKK